MSAKEYLSRIKKIDTLIRNNNLEIVKNAGSLDMTETTTETRKLKEERKSIIETIKKLPESEYDVLFRKYVQGESFYEIASARGISYSGATAIHGRALKKLSEIIKGG